MTTLGLLQVGAVKRITHASNMLVTTGHTLHIVVSSNGVSMWPGIAFLY